MSSDPLRCSTVQEAWAKDRQLALHVSDALLSVRWG